MSNDYDYRDQGGLVLLGFVVGILCMAGVMSLRGNDSVELAYEKGFKVGQVEAACGRMHFQPKVKSTYWVKIKQKSSK
jgi:hypothetical protein